MSRERPLGPLTGDEVTCEGCGKKYRYFIWAFGNNMCLCRRCVNNRPQACLGDDRLDEGEPGELDHLTNFEKTYGGGREGSSSGG